MIWQSVVEVLLLFGSGGGGGGGRRGREREWVDMGFW